MPIRRLIALGIVAAFAIALAVQPAMAQESGPTTGSFFIEPAAQVQQQQGQNLTTVRKDHNAEISFFIGGLIGGDLTSLLDDGFSLSSTLENGRTYGGRVGYYTFPFGVEGSFTYSKSGLGITAGFSNATVSIGARVMYAEGNVLLIIIPGPVQPFVTGGGGLHSYEFYDLAGIKAQKWGWNFGGGVKANIKRVSLRVDLRDHLTQISASDLNITDELADLLDIGEQSLHNVEISFGIGFKF